MTDDLTDTCGELLAEAGALGVSSLQITYHINAIVICAWPKYPIEVDEKPIVVRARKPELAATRLLWKLRGPRRLKRLRAMEEAYD